MRNFKNSSDISLKINSLPEVFSINKSSEEFNFNHVVNNTKKVFNTEKNLKELNLQKSVFENENNYFNNKEIFRNFSFTGENKKTTPTNINVSTVNYNSINSELDIDRVVNSITRKVTESLNTDFEALHR